MNKDITSVEHWEEVKAILDKSGKHTATELLLTLAESDVVLKGPIIERVADYISEKHREAVQDGLQRAAELGALLGRPRGNSPEVKKAVKMYLKGGKSMREVEKLTGVSRSSISKVIKQMKQRGEV